MSEKPTLYFTPRSPPSRGALLGIRALGLDVNVKDVNLLAGEQKTEEFKKMNPVGKVPVFVDSDGFTLSESRAILAYLVNTRKPGDDLYPNDPKKRAIIDQRLYYDATVLFPVIRSIVRPIIYQGATLIDQSLLEEANEVIKMVDSFLNDSEYFAGDKVTIADLSILANITGISEFGFDFAKYPKLNAWYAKMKSVPGYEENKVGAKSLADFVTERVGKIIF